MGSDLAREFPAAGEVYARAAEVLGIDLADLCFNGPADQLNATDICQPAIFTTSVAIWTALESSGAGLKPDGAAGLSLGEYTALWLAGSISFEDGLRLVRRRGQLMQEASEANPSGMVSIMGLDEQGVSDICEAASEAGVAVPANFNCPGQIVVSGSESACRKVLELAEERDAKAVPLSVAGAFHSPLMESAADGLREVLAATSVNEPRIGVMANVHGDYYTDETSVREGLHQQLVRPVRWQRCMEKLIDDGFDNFVEIGPGRVLAGLMRRISRRTKVRNISSAKDLAS
jgi:[acyl-carrier-protein] S-malonyltransferase